MTGSFIQEKITNFFVFVSESQAGAKRWEFRFFESQLAFLYAV